MLGMALPVIALSWYQPESSQLNVVVVVADSVLLGWVVVGGTVAGFVIEGMVEVLRMDG